MTDLTENKATEYAYCVNSMCLDMNGLVPCIEMALCIKFIIFKFYMVSQNFTYLILKTFLMPYLLPFPISFALQFEYSSTLAPYEIYFPYRF